MMLKGFFANINMKGKNKVGSQVVVELFTLFLAFMLMFTIKGIITTKRNSVTNSEEQKLSAKQNVLTQF